MPIEFRCPGCRSDLRAPDSKRGTEGACPKCRAGLRVPRCEGFWVQCRRAQRLSKGPGTPTVILGITMLSLFSLLFTVGAVMWVVARVTGWPVWSADDAHLAVWDALWCIALPVLCVRFSVALMSGKRWALLPATGCVVLVYGLMLAEVAVLQHLREQRPVDPCTVFFFSVPSLAWLAWGVDRLRKAAVREFCRY